MSTDFILTDFLKSVRLVKNQVQILQCLEMSDDDKKIVYTALEQLREDLDKTIE